MTDTTRPSASNSGGESSPRSSQSGQQGTSQGSNQGNPQGQRRRRRRRRGRRPAGNQNNRNSQNKQQSGERDHTSAHASGTADSKSDNNSDNKPKRSRRRRGRRRSSSSAKPNTNTRNNQQGKSNNRGVRSGNQNRNRPSQAMNRKRQYSSAARMETRDETSAGGLVVSGMAEAVRDDNSVDLSRIYVALIGRLDRRGRLLWSMPKGHVEEGEHQWQTAEREVWEETGIEGEAFATLGTIDYWFVSDGVRIHKTVHHSLLRFVDGELNDEDPEVTEVTWVPVDQLIEHLAYADERKLARYAYDNLPDLARKERAAGRATPR
ncbi:NUDIX hydrolase [Corynebacterium cystitidis]|uniref:NUDIX hydrolase n=1 Tax=Corynebacterium cystitidis TaxID=35757 RepID=UPI00211EE6E2|nr:NUDIX hydrolase [Corynebacterium cystitidis]